MVVFRGKSFTTAYKSVLVNFLAFIWSSVIIRHIVENCLLSNSFAQTMFSRKSASRYHTSCVVCIINLKSITSKLDFRKQFCIWIYLFYSLKYCDLCRPHDVYRVDLFRGVNCIAVFCAFFMYSTCMWKATNSNGCNRLYVINSKDLSQMVPCNNNGVFAVCSITPPTSLLFTAIRFLDSSQKHADHWNALANRVNVDSLILHRYHIENAKIKSDAMWIVLHGEV